MRTITDRRSVSSSAVRPVAEEAGVDLALHSVAAGAGVARGVPRLFRSVGSFERTVAPVQRQARAEALPGLLLADGRDRPRRVRRFGERDEIVFVHFRDVVGTVPQFNETFVDEGNFDTVAAVRTLRDVGFDGVAIPDHVSAMVGDDWRHRARGFTVGYLRGVVDAVRSER